MQKTGATTWLSFLESSPLLGLLQLIVHGSWDWMLKSRRTRALVNRETEFGKGGAERAERITNQLCALGSRRFPLVMFIEDVHNANDTLQEMVAGLLRRGSHLLVITTTWPGLIEERPILAGLARDSDERVLRVLDDGTTDPRLGDSSGLAELGPDDLERIIRHYYPSADPDTVDGLVRRTRNPLLLEDVCHWHTYRESHGERGDLMIAPAAIEALPREIGAFYRKSWMELPDPVRLRYATAAAISPEAINSETGKGYRAWNAAVLDNVIEDLNLPASPEQVRDAGDSRDRYGWVVRVGEQLCQWAETDQYRIASTASDGELARHLTNAPRRVPRALARALEHEDPQDPHRARTVVALHTKRFITDPDAAAAAIAVVFNDLGYDDTRTAERQSLYDIYVGIEPSPSCVSPKADWEIRFSGIKAILEAGDPRSAVRHYRLLVARAEAKLGPGDPTTLRSRHELAEALRRDGAPHDAINVLRQVIQDRADILGARHRDTLASCNRHAAALFDVGQLDASIEAFEKLIKDQRKLLGGKDPETLKSRQNIAVALWQNGRLTEAINRLQRVLDVQVEVLGENNYRTLKSRHDLAVLHWQAGRLRQSVRMLKAVARDHHDTLGSGHPETLRSRSNLAAAVSEAGRPREERRPVRGVDHRSGRDPEYSQHPHHEGAPRPCGSAHAGGAPSGVHRLVRRGDRRPGTGARRRQHRCPEVASCLRHFTGQRGPLPGFH